MKKRLPWSPKRRKPTWRTVGEAAKCPHPVALNSPLVAESLRTKTCHNQKQAGREQRAHHARETNQQKLRSRDSDEGCGQWGKGVGAQSFIATSARAAEGTRPGQPGPACSTCLGLAHRHFPEARQGRVMALGCAPRVRRSIAT